MNRFDWKLTEDGVELTLSSVAKRFFRETTSTVPVSQWSAGDDAALLRGLSALTPISRHDRLRPGRRIAEDTA